MKRLSSTLINYAVIAAASAVLCGCAVTAPLKGDKAKTLSKPSHGIEQTVVQSDNPAAVSRQDQETVRTRSYMVLPTLIVGNELLIIGGVGVAVGGWFLAHRHGRLQGFVDANKNGIDDSLEVPK
jgi:hypothetical protein